ncbi:GEVED domain-containing protein [Maribacter aestuarii]|uniref:GEVED domain-containing protein n=1 Tax=Maribacter aestuarii TaxID=1130723 RepID=UPI00248CCACD|nr:GEVED domain-containing protein [Maribacter aestuarii]
MYRSLLVKIILFLCLGTCMYSGAQTTISSQVSQGSDDAEERISSGNISLTSSDLEITSDGANNQLVGIRFQNIFIPQGTTILSASIQFTTDETDSGTTSVVITGEDADNASTYTSSIGNISSRTLTTASVAWNTIPAWNTVGQSGFNQRTPDLTNIVQEIVNRGGWTSGNAMAFIINGIGERTAESYNGDPARAPVLNIVADFITDPLPSIVPNSNRGLPFIYYIADNRSELYSVAPDPTASPLPSPTFTNITLGGSPITFSGEGGGYRSTDRLVYVFIGADPTNSSDLYSIDPATGVATLVKSNIVPGHVDGAEFYINNATGEEVFLILYQNGTSGGPDRIMAVNPNASATRPAWSPYAGYPVVLSGARTQADGLSWNPDTAEFYIQNDNNVDYYTVDITTGNTTFAFTTSLGVDGEGITYASDGTNYIEDENIAGQGRTIFIVDTDTGNLIPAAQLGSTGDVESIMGNLGVRNDAGDAPSSYGYAAHILPVLTATGVSIYLGNVPPDSEDPFGNFSIGTADDNNGDDEDGVTSGGSEISGQVFDLGQTKTLDIVANGSGLLNAWIDFNRDGDFNDGGEQIASNVAPSGGSITLNVPIPITANSGTSYARFRYSSEAGLSPGNSEATDGEVEDYRIVLRDATACSAGFTLYERTHYNYISATAVIIDNSVGNENNALGSNNNTTASFNNNNDELILEMASIINSGDLATVNGPDGDSFDVWISSSSTGPWTFLGSNALDYSFTSPIDWQYIRLRRASGSTVEISYIEAEKSISSYTCEADFDGDSIPDFADLDDDNDGITDCVESSDQVTSGFAWSLNNPAGNLTMDTVYDSKITDWAIDATTNMVLTTGIYSVVGSNVHITSMSATSLESAIINNDFIEVSFTTGIQTSSYVIDNIISGWFQPTQGDSYRSTLMYSEGTTGTWYTLAKDVFHTNDGSGSSYLTFDHLNASALELKSNTQYKFRVYTYGQIDDSSESYSIFDDFTFNISACRAQDIDTDASSDHLDGDSDGDGCSDANEAYADSNADGGDNDYFGNGNPPPTNADGTVISASYATPADTDSNGIPDHEEAGATPMVNTQPQDQEVADGADATFSVSASGGILSYQWQVSTDSGINYSDISGATANSYTENGVSAAENGSFYRVIISDGSFVCGTTTSSSALLIVSADSDGDGIIDKTDLDDDNDGIPDNEELSTVAGNSQPACGGDTSMDFSASATLVSGTALLQGAVYRIANVTTGVDALVTIAKTVNATPTNIDNNSSDTSAFRPQTAFNLTNIGDRGYIEYNIQFVSAGGSSPVVINKFFMNLNDIDGNSNYAEQIWTDNPTSYTISNPTELTMTTDGSWVIGTAGTSEFPGAGNTFPEVNFGVSYTSKSSMSIRVGAEARVAGANAGGRQHNIEFSCLTNYNNPENYGIDIDSDGVANHLDLDSDNDGIYDAVEAGHNRPHNNGVLISTFGGNGLADLVETLPESGTLNYTILDTDGSAPPNYLDTDSDDDGCSDANEAYADANADGGDNEYYDVGDPPTTDANGRVTSATYPVPVDSGGNGTQDYVEDTAPVILTQPFDVAICPGCSTQFPVVASNADSYQWQLFNGSIWVDLTNTGIHSGATTDTLIITNATPADNGNEYRVLISSDDYICGPIISDTTILTVRVTTVITNRRITYRVRKN